MVVEDKLEEAAAVAPDMLVVVVQDMVEVVVVVVAVQDILEVVGVQDMLEVVGVEAARIQKSVVEGHILDVVEVVVRILEPMVEEHILQVEGVADTEMVREEAEYASAAFVPRQFFLQFHYLRL